MKNFAFHEIHQDYRGKLARPQDFDEFWDEELRNIADIPSYKLVEHDFSLLNFRFFELFFYTPDGAEIYARIVAPKNKDNEQKYGVIFHFHGYMGRGLDWSAMISHVAASKVVVSMDVRGQAGLSSDGPRPSRGNTVKGHIVRGLNSGARSLYYKDVYLDCYRLIEIIAKLDFVNQADMQVYGGSQGGALALVAAALNPRIRQAIVIYPFLSDFAKVLEMGSNCEAYDEIFRYFRFHDPFHQTEDYVMNCLAYIDIKNFAPRIRAKTKMFIGLMDDVCYPITQFAIYNNLTCDKEYILLPEYGHEDIHVRLWDEIYNSLCDTKLRPKLLQEGDKPC